MSIEPISPELALVDPAALRTALLDAGEGQEATVIDNGNHQANGNGAVELVEHPAAEEVSPETLLFRTGLLSPDQLGELVQERVASGRAAEEIVVERGWLDAGTVARALGHEPAAAAPAPVLEPHPDPFALPVAATQLAPEPEPQQEPVVVQLPVESGVAESGPVEVVQQPAPPPAATVEFRVSIRFVGNECVEIATHAGAGEAKSAAQALVAQLSSESAEWPFVGGRFVRPDAVLTVDVDAVVR